MNILKTVTLILCILVSIKIFNHLENQHKLSTMRMENIKLDTDLIRLRIKQQQELKEQMISLNTHERTEQFRKALRQTF
jgi:hypothetical protein